MTSNLFILLSALLACFACAPKSSDKASVTDTTVLRLELDTAAGSISAFRSNEKSPILTQNAKEDFRPYIHPIVAPDGKGVLTEYSPGHHKHQTGLYWGFTRVNGRDYFHHPSDGYWKRVSVEIIQPEGKTVRWQTVYDMLSEDGATVLKETQTWSMVEVKGKYYLDLEWKGEAKTDVTIGEYDYGGLFLRMPWREGIKGEVINAARQRNEKAEGQRAMWVDVGMQVEGRDDLAHIAIFDHMDNERFPQPWRVDGQLGIGPALARLGDWKIAKGKTEMLQYRMVVYGGALNDVEMIKSWETYVGDSTYATASLWDLARDEGRTAKFLTPEEAVKSMTLTDGFKANVWAAEPMMTQPMAFCWDDRGRLWIAENKDYESRGEGFSNSGKSRILILEDTDHDGKADSRKVFLEGIAFPAAIAVGFDGLFLGAPPNLMYIPDRNKDDKADMNDIEIRLTGWGIRDRHETLNSLHWGPDGWLYGCQGFATPSKIKLAKGTGRVYRHNDPFPKDILEGEGVEINGGVWRYHPVKDKFEVVAHGFSNPWGIDYDAKGQMFISACVIPHLWHVIPGGLYHRQGGQHYNPYAYNDIKTIADHRHRSAHGGLRVYLSDAFPTSQYGRLFMANIHEHAVLSDVIERKGSGFTARHGEDFAMANNAQWVGFSMEVGPDGALYVLDWHDADICGADVLNQETGRIFRISPEKSLAENFEGRYSDLTKLTDAQLVELQSKKSNWHASRARVILQGRAAAGKLQKDTHERLRSLFDKHADGDLRLRAMWSLHVTGGFNESQLLKVLSDKDEYVRAWAIQLICENNSPSATAIQEFNRMAVKDPSPVVRLYLASALQRINFEQRWSIAQALLTHGEDAQDHNLPKMIWYGVEPLVADNAARALALTSKSQIPMVTRYIARRSVDANAIETLITHLEEAESPAVLLEGMLDGLEGRKDIITPKNWQSVYGNLRSSRDEKVKRLALAIAQQFGDTEAAQEFLATVRDNGVPVEQRVKALHALARKQRVELVQELPSLYNDPKLRIEGIRATAEYDVNDLGKLLIEKYPQFNAAEKLEVVQTLASRPGYGWMLTNALRNNVIPKSDVPVYAARQLLRVVGSGFLEVWGAPLDELSNDQNASYARYKKLLTNEAIANGNTVNGRLIFSRTCGPCHKMYNEGGTLGPDITGSNRTNVDYVLSNVLNPSGEIQDDYKMVVITSTDGRTYVGNVVAENERQLSLRVVGQDAIVINKSDIQSRETTDSSMMPQGLFDALTDKEVLDLVSYLRTSAQVKLPNSEPLP